MQDMDKKQIMKTFLRVIDHISNKEFQKNAWIKGEGVYFDEIINLFSDLGDPIFEKYKEFGVTENQYMLLKKFQSEFEAFYDEHDLPEEFIDTPEWEHIMNMAKEVLKSFGRV
jgi:hypothetical protein